VAAQMETNYWSTWDDRGAMVPAGKSMNLFAWPEAPADPRWARLEALRGRVGIRVCYCSVFDECYVRDSGHREPLPIEACAAPAVPYSGG
jgi:hypothetical protein